MSMMSLKSIMSNEHDEHNEHVGHNVIWIYFYVVGLLQKIIELPQNELFFQILGPCLLWGSPLFLKCPSRTGGATSAFPHSIIDNHDKKYIGGGRRRGRKDWDTYYYSLSDTHTSAPKMSQRMCSKNIRVVSHVWPGCVKT